MEDMKKKLREPVSAVAAVVLFYLVIEAAGVTCPIKFITGISCAGCGMSRAWLAFLRLDLHKAFYYHPLFFTPPLLLVVWLMKKHINERIYKGILFTIILLYVTIYVYRMLFSGGDIVVFRPQDNIIFRMIKRYHT